MITFDDIRVEDKETYTIIPMSRALDLSWFLTKNGIHHSIISCLDCEKSDIASQFTQESLTELMSAYADVDESDDNACILVSNLNPDDLVQKTIMIIKSQEDEDLKKHWRQEQMLTDEEKEDLEDRRKHGIEIRRQQS